MSGREAVRLIRLAAAMPVERKLWLAYFLCATPVVALVLRFVPLRRFVPLMGAPLDNRRVCVVATETQWRKARRMGILMHAVGGRLLRRSRCMVEALCLKWLMNRYGIPAVVHLGARLDRSVEAGMRAHAWVRVGPVAVIGGPSEREYPVVATFTTPVLENDPHAHREPSLAEVAETARLTRTEGRRQPS